ncbi:MAG: hypothetical protein ACYC0C_01615 [Devosia sp.]
MIEIPPTVQSRLKSLGLDMTLTCASVPEQWELFKDGKAAGYIRVRGSHFTVDYPEAADENLLDETVDGFGGFTDAEREGCLLRAIDLIQKRMELLK